MKNGTRKVGITLLLSLFALVLVEPAMAEHRSHNQHCRHYDNPQPFSQSYYNYQYNKYQTRRYDQRRSWNKHRNRNNRHYSSYGNQYGSYYGGGHKQRYERDHQRHFHRHGIFRLGHQTAGYAYCEGHGGYYRSGDTYY